MSSPMAEPVNQAEALAKKVLALGISTLSHRLLMFLTVFSMGGVFAWAMLDNTILHVVTAGVYCVFATYIFHRAMSATTARSNP